MKKRVLSALLAGAIALSLAVPALAAVPSTDEAAQVLAALDIMVGDENGDLSLTAPVTRAEFVKMMTAASTYKDAVGTGSGASLFTDVKSGYWANGYIQLAVEQGWVTGYVDGSFRPEATITLEEACTALLRLLGFDSSSLSGSFPDAQLSKARSVGLLDDMDVSQGQTLTRQDCVTLFYNLLISENSAGTVYGTTLGYTVTNGEVDYSTLVSNDTKGPYVSTDGTASLPFSAEGVTVYRNGPSPTSPSSSSTTSITTTRACGPCGSIPAGSPVRSLRSPPTGRPPPPSQWRGRNTASAPPPPPISSPVRAASPTVTRSPSSWA